jgi:hypothetical protein
MAAGQWTTFNHAIELIGAGTIKPKSDTFKYAFINSTLTPDAATADPCWGAGGSTNLSSYEAAPATGNYTAGGIAMTNTTWVESAGVTSFDSDDLVVAQTGLNPQDCRWVICYSDTAANKNALGFIDLDGVTDLSVGGFSYTVPASGYFSIARA